MNWHELSHVSAFIKRSPVKEPQDTMRIALRILVWLLHPDLEMPKEISIPVVPVDLSRMLYEELVNRSYEHLIVRHPELKMFGVPKPIFPETRARVLLGDYVAELDLIEKSLTITGLLPTPFWTQTI